MAKLVDYMNDHQVKLKLTNLLCQLVTKTAIDVKTKYPVHCTGARSLEKTLWYELLL